MQRILKGAGYQVTVANDGLEGWEKVQSQEFDAVVSDVENARLSGLELTTQIRQHPEYNDLPVILVTTLNSRMGSSNRTRCRCKCLSHQRRL